MTFHDVTIDGLDGPPLDLRALTGSAVLVVNVASFCGLTPQYAALEELHQRYAARGFTVLGVPCNQFGLQEPGDATEIGEFCSTKYGVTFPLTTKVEVNGPRRHPLYDLLTQVRDADGEGGDVDWNFEKFLVSPRGSVVARFRPGTTPNDASVVAAIEATLPSWETRPARDIVPGDVIRVRGTVITVSRVATFGLRPDSLGFVEDTPSRWLKRPAGVDDDVEVLAR
jgi:glutathione peroxidase